jgi:thiol-disulfide isomerase/thioredoxin
MKKTFRFIVIVFVIVCLNKVQAQVVKPAVITLAQLSKLNDRVLVRDSAGKSYNYTAWNSMIASGRFGIRVVTFPDQKPALIIGRLNKAERSAFLEQLPKPEESSSFKTGESFKHFKETDISGTEYDTKQLVGKTVVITFCNIKNLSCLRAMPDMNELAEAYKYDTNIVFLAVPVDSKQEIQDFIKTTPSRMRFFEKGKAINAKLNVTTHPTYLVLDQSGSVQYHSAGYSPASAYWIGKTIEQLKSYTAAR